MVDGRTRLDDRVPSIFGHGSLRPLPVQQRSTLRRIGIDVNAMRHSAV
jgi:hypothetical protein